MKALLQQLWSDEDGGSLIEYVLIVGIIVLASAAVLTSNTSGLRPAVKNHFNAKATVLNPAGK